MRETDKTYQNSIVYKDENGYESPVRHSKENIYVPEESIYAVVTETYMKDKTLKSNTATIWKVITTVLTVLCLGCIGWVLLLILKNCPIQQLQSSQNQCRIVPRCSGKSVYNTLFNETCCIKLQNFTTNWDGFFYLSSTKTRMNMSVTFYENKMTGKGSDLNNNFRIIGNWEKENGVFQFVKIYPEHNVSYHGRMGGNLCSMSGSWTLKTGLTGEFTLFTKLC